MHKKMRLLSSVIEGCEARRLFSAYTITNLGGLTPYAINDSSVVSGQGNSHAYYYYLGKYGDLGAGPGASAVTYAENNQGAAAGYYTLSTGPGVAFYDDAGSLTPVAAIGGSSLADGVNDAGTVVGTGNVGGADHAFVSANGTAVDLGTFGGTASEATGINNSGLVVGRAQLSNGDFHAFSYAGALHDLGTLGGSTSDAFAVNTAGEIVGDSTTSGGLTHAFIDVNGQMVDIDTLGDSASSARAINSLGVVVGDANASASTVGTSGDFAFIYQNGVMTNLNTLIPAGSGYVLNTASGINDSGQIVGTAMFQGNQVGFILTPSVSTFATFSNGTLTIQGTAGPDTIAVSDNAGTVTATMNSLAPEAFGSSSITSIIINGGGFGDTISMAGVPIQSTISGGAGADSISGGSLGDSISGGAGPDTIGGAGGNDTLNGGKGNNSLKGGAGDDLITAGIGNVTVKGGIGNDSIVGGSGNDSINGNAGNDTIVAGSGSSNLDGGPGTNKITGSVIAGYAPDTINAGSGADSVTASNADSILGQTGDDSVTRV